MNKIKLSKRQINVLRYLHKEKDVCNEDVNENTLKSLIKRDLIKEVRPFWYSLTELGKTIEL